MAKHIYIYTILIYISKYTKYLCDNEHLFPIACMADIFIFSFFTTNKYTFFIILKKRNE